MNIIERFNKRYRRHLVAEDVAYNSTSRLDVYATQSTKKRRPVIIFFYGGSWQSGNKETYRFVADRLARATDSVVIVPDYQKFPAVRYPTFITEAWDVVRWVQAHADSFNADSTNYTVIGHSAGGHTAATLGLGALKPNDLMMPRACVDLAGPNSWVGAGFSSVFGEALNKRSGFPTTIAQTLNTPITTKFLLIHGRADAVVWPSQQKEFAEALRAKNIPVECLRPYTTHIGLIVAVGSPFGPFRNVGRNMIKFLKEVQHVSQT